MPGHRSLTTAVAVLLLATPLAAQGNPSGAVLQNQGPAAARATLAEPASDAVRTPSSLAPTRVNATVGVHAPATATALPTTPPPSTMERDPAMMIIGGAALLVGAVVGGKPGTIVMIVGGTIGLVGLWRYLQ